MTPRKSPPILTAVDCESRHYIVMDHLLTEVLALVAGLLPLAHLKELRLVSRIWADTAYPVPAQHLSIVNTEECLEEFERFMHKRKGTARYAKKLTIYHGAWPVCSRDAWETHPLRRDAVARKLAAHSSAINDPLMAL
jgi:hypothetical protein